MEEETPTPRAVGAESKPAVAGGPMPQLRVPLPVAVAVPPPTPGKPQVLTLALFLSPYPRAVVHAVDGACENAVQPLSSSEVDELIHKADEAALSEGAAEEAVRVTPTRRHIAGVQAQPGEATSGPPGPQPGQEPPVTMIFMGYQNVEDEAETKKVLGLQDAVTAELVVIRDAAEPAPPNGSAAEPPAQAGTCEESQAGPETTTSDPQDLDVKKQRCKCCSVM